MSREQARIARQGDKVASRGEEITHSHILPTITFSLLVSETSTESKSLTVL